MMKVWGWILLLMPSAVWGQFDSTAYQIASTITAETLKEYVMALTSPAFTGREHGSEGNLKAADYIAQQFQKSDVNAAPGNDGYFQPLGTSKIKWKDIRLTVSGVKVEHLRDYLCLPQYSSPSPGEMVISEMTFLGYGIDDPRYSDYAGKDLMGKHLLIYAGEPRTNSGQFLLSGSDSVSIWSTDMVEKIKAARQAGAASLWIIEDKLRDKVIEARRFIMSNQLLPGDLDKMEHEYVPAIQLSTTLAQILIGKKTKRIIRLREKITTRGKPYSTAIPVQIAFHAMHDLEAAPGKNVLGYIEGIDPRLKDEIIVVTAHFDHLGKRGDDIFYGADDNASGTAAVMEIAEALAIAKHKGVGPKRSVLCMLVTGEEKGLLGSAYYADHPVFPIEQTVANVNIDMIGRTDEKHNHSNYTYVIGADRLSTELHEINESVNQTYTKLELDYTYNLESDPNRFYYRSDHYNFAKKGIPAIFYFSGVHEDYHRPTDTPDKLMYEKAETIARLAFHTTLELANREERLKVDVGNDR
jgi:hypothetical protein